MPPLRRPEPVRREKALPLLPTRRRNSPARPAKATEDISHKITTIQTNTSGAVEAIGTISSIIHQVNEISTTIATAVEEQSATTYEITRNVADAASGSGDITRNIAGVAEAAQGASNSA